MEISTMGKVLVTAKVENLSDLYDVQKERLTQDQVRTIEVSDALVDTGAMKLSLPSRLIDELGLQRVGKRRVRTTAGIVEANICEAVRLSVQGRTCIGDVAEIPDDCPVLIGQIPLEDLDYVVDPVGGKLIGNPDHGGEHMIDIL